MGATCSPRSRTWWSFPLPRWRRSRRCIRRCISGASFSGWRSRPPCRRRRCTPPRRPCALSGRWRTLAVPGRNLAQAPLDTQTLENGSTGMSMITKTILPSSWSFRLTEWTNLHHRVLQCSHFHSDNRRPPCPRSGSGRVCRTGVGRGWRARPVGYTGPRGNPPHTRSGTTERPVGCTFHGRT